MQTQRKSRSHDYAYLAVGRACIVVDYNEGYAHKNPRDTEFYSLSFRFVEYGFDG
jgi:hypothetical protein